MSWQRNEIDDLRLSDPLKPYENRLMTAHMTFAFSKS